MRGSIVLSAAVLTLAIMAPCKAVWSNCSAVDPDRVWSNKDQIQAINAALMSRDSTIFRNSKHQFFGGNTPQGRACLLYQRGIFFHVDGHYSEAIDSYSHAIGAMDTFVDAYVARGDAYADLGKPDMAAADYATAASLSRALDADWFNKSCWVRAVRGHPLDLALADCTRALAGEPKDANILDSRVLVHFRMGRYDLAIADADAALTGKPNLAGSLYLRGLSQIRLGRTAEGEADIARAKRLEPSIAERFKAWGVMP